MNRANDIIFLLEDFRQAYQVFVTPDENSVRIRFADDSLSNRNLRFPPVTMGHDEFFDLFNTNDNTRATFQVALERGDTFGLFTNAKTISRLARKGVVGDDPQKYQHSSIKQAATNSDHNRFGQISARI